MGARAKQVLAPSFERYRAIESALGNADFSNRLIQYTNFDKFESMLRSQSLWFGRLADMNDPSETEHYLNGILGALHSIELPVDLKVVEALLRQQASELKTGTYSTSWCEYFEAEHDGLLDMWRTYGGNGSGLGVVIDSSAMLPSNLNQQKLGFGINASKVKYLPAANIGYEVSDMFRRLSNVEFLKGQPMAVMGIVALILAKAPCVKHQSYAVEREVRFLFYKQMHDFMPGVLPNFSSILNPVTDARTDREFYALPLIHYPEYDLDLRPKTLLKRVVIGSNQATGETTKLVKALLGDYGLSGVEVVVSSIPMR